MCDFTLCYAEIGNQLSRQGEHAVKGLPEAGMHRGLFQLSIFLQVQAWNQCV